jgi:hypothetical protein
VCPALHLGGKLRRPGRINAVLPGTLLHATCQLTGRRFLLDTGSSFSIYPHKSSMAASGPHMTGPDGAIIPSWGVKELTMKFDNTVFKWQFVLAAISFPIIGIDFLKHFDLLVHPTSGRLIKLPPTVAAVVPAAQAAQLGGHPQRPSSAAIPSGPAQRPNSLAQLSGPAQRPSSAAQLGGSALPPPPPPAARRSLVLSTFFRGGLCNTAWAGMHAPWVLFTISSSSHRRRRGSCAPTAGRGTPARVPGCCEPFKAAASPHP